MGRAAISLGWPVHLLYQALNVSGLYAGVWGCHEESVLNFDPMGPQERCGSFREAVVMPAQRSGRASW